MSHTTRFEISDVPTRKIKLNWRKEAILGEWDTFPDSNQSHHIIALTSQPQPQRQMWHRQRKGYLVSMLYQTRTRRAFSAKLCDWCSSWCMLLGSLGLCCTQTHSPSHAVSDNTTLPQTRACKSRTDTLYLAHSATNKLTHLCSQCIYCSFVGYIPYNTMGEFNFC